MNGGDRIFPMAAVIEDNSDPRGRLLRDPITSTIAVTIVWFFAIVRNFYF